ncbi:hypothetical protein ACWG0P_08365 [Amedibacillus sp. YH-ame6]
MKTVFEILNKKYDSTITKRKNMKKTWKSMIEMMEERSIKVPGNSDTDFFQSELIVQSIHIKEKFEEVFLDTYVSMHDYWYDLTYQERKKQMNIEIDKLKSELPFFSYDSQEIYMPCFDAKFNHLYTDEIVLLDLKQYHTFIRTFASQVLCNVYGVLPFQYGFSSARVIIQNEYGFVLYHKTVNRLYVYHKDTFVKALSLCPEKLPENDDVLILLAKELLLDNEDELIDILMESTLVSKRMIKKLHKLKAKKQKRVQKEQKKKEKKKKKE